MQIERDRQLNRAHCIITAAFENPCTGRRLNAPTKKKLFLLFDCLTSIQSKQSYSFQSDKYGKVIHVRIGDIRKSWAQLAGMCAHVLGVTTVRTIENLTKILEEMDLLSIDREELERPGAHGQRHLKVIRIKSFSSYEEFEAEQAVEQLIESVNETIAEPIEILEELEAKELVTAELYSEQYTKPKHLFPIVSLLEIHNTKQSNSEYVTIGKRLIAPAETENWTVEIADGGVSKNRVLVPRDEIPEEVDGEYYAAWIGEKAGQYYTPWVIWDIDAEQVEEALKTTRDFVTWLNAEFVPDEAIRVVFSTRRGFHVYLDSRVIGLHPSENLHEQIKRFAKRLLPECDESLYAKRHVIGVPNSLHRATKLYYAPLTIEELFGMSIAQMRAHARRPQEFEPRAEEMQPVKSLVEIFNAANSTEEKKSGFAGLKQIKERVNEGHYAWKGVTSGQRDKAMFELAQRYCRLGLTIQEAYVLTLDANERNQPPMPRDSVRKKVNSAYSREGIQIV